jgi:peptidoglycan/LPS O-acetylase OafA/YrhL
MVATPEVVTRPQERLEYARPAPRIAGRIDWLDGLRALAALAVVVVHAMEVFGLGLGSFWGVPETQGGLAGTRAGELLGLTYEYVVGQFVWAVEVFIVLSGFSLMLPVMRSAERGLRGGTLRFFQRRARRILPPYYAALLLGILLILIVPGMSEPSGAYRYRDLMIPLTPGAVVSHLFLVHNLSQEWDLKIVPPMWSIAVEWQIYFLFPALLLLWRRLGALWAVALALGFGMLQGALLRPLGLPMFPFSHAWYVGLFALGMAGAALGMSGHPTARRVRERTPWLALAALSFGLMAVLKVALRHDGGVPEWIGDPLIGLSTLCLLVYLVRDSRGSPGLLTRLLSARPLVKLGQFSYSLYLVHTLVLVSLARIFVELGLGALTAQLLIFTVGIPLAVAGSYLFFLGFERPFLSAEARKHASA